MLRKMASSTAVAGCPASSGSAMGRAFANEGDVSSVPETRFNKRKSPRQTAEALDAGG